MRTRHLIFASMLVFAVACGGDDEPPATGQPEAPTTGPAPAPTGPIVYTTGEAQVEVSGAQDVTFTATLDTATENSFDPADSQANLEYRSGEGQLLRLTLTFDEESLSDPFLAVGLGGESIADEEYYPDAFHTQCAVTMQSFEQTSLEGTFTCTEIPSAVTEDKTISTNGTFSASA